MATRANIDLKEAIIKNYTVDPAAGGPVTAGKPVKFGSTDQYILPAVAADAALVFGYAIETKTAGQQCDVVPKGNIITGVLVGTGGATRGVMQKIAADGTGVTDVTAGTDVTQGRAMQSGVVGDLIGLMIGGAQ